MISKVLINFLEWLPIKIRKKCIDRMSTRWIEDNIQDLPINIKDIFYIRTWSFDFIETNLEPEHTDMWDHVSTWYTLTDAFCERNIDWLNFYELVYSQCLSHNFYINHIHKIDWISSPLDKNKIFKLLY